jgi:hypothetical protein
MIQASKAAILSMRNTRFLIVTIYNCGKGSSPRNPSGHADRMRIFALLEEIALFIARLVVWMTDGFGLRRSFLAEKNG